MLPVPVTIVSGFLGSGKTTLINRILVQPHGLAIAVLVNDFGAVNIDARQIREVSNNVIGMRNGCICCSMQGDMIAQVSRLLNEQEWDHIVIESSGVSEPGNIVRGLGYPQLRGKVFDAAVITLVDTELFPDLQGDARYIADEQLATADIVLLNKTDLVSSRQLELVREHCACPGLRIIECQFADVPFEMIFPVFHVPRPGESTPADQGMCGMFESQVWQPVGRVRLDVLKQALSSISQNVIRVKGYVQAHDSGAIWLVQAVGRRVNFSQAAKTQTPELVLIAKRNEIDWSSCFEILDASVPVNSEIN